jgi:pyruvate/2-oxoglutarate dehydrogenase complex dihydrolipoamide dehydrogenase (E3) component
MSTTPNTPSGQNAKVEEYDLVILGSGTGGTVAAWTFASKGQRVAVIERKYVGGSCPNIACLPSKNVIHSAKVASYFRRSEEFAAGDGEFDPGDAHLADSSTRALGEHLLSRYKRAINIGYNKANHRMRSGCRGLRQLCRS